MVHVLPQKSPLICVANARAPLVWPSPQHLQISYEIFRATIRKSGLYKFSGVEKSPLPDVVVSGFRLRETGWYFRALSRSWWNVPARWPELFRNQYLYLSYESSPNILLCFASVPVWDWCPIAFRLSWKFPTWDDRWSFHTYSTVRSNKERCRVLRWKWNHSGVVLQFPVQMCFSWGAWSFPGYIRRFIGTERKEFRDFPASDKSIQFLWRKAVFIYHARGIISIELETVVREPTNNDLFSSCHWGYTTTKRE